MLAQDASYDHLSDECHIIDAQSTVDTESGQAYIVQTTIEVLLILVCGWICVWLISCNEHTDNATSESVQLLERSLKHAAMQDSDVHTVWEDWQEKLEAAELENARLSKLAENFESRAKTAEDCLEHSEDARLGLASEVATKTAEIVEVRRKQSVLEALSKEQAEKIAAINISLTAAQKGFGSSTDAEGVTTMGGVSISTTLGCIEPESSAASEQLVEVRQLLTAAEGEVIAQKLKVAALEREHKAVLQRADMLVGEATERANAFAVLQERFAIAEKQIEAYKSKIEALERESERMGPVQEEAPVLARRKGTRKGA